MPGPSLTKNGSDAPNKKFYLDFFWQGYYLFIMPPKNADGSTKEKLLRAAKKEFIKKGFSKASLRTICKNAGVTTGALYFFFQDKEDLFDSIVQPVIEHISEILKKHFSYESSLIESESATLKNGMAKESGSIAEEKQIGPKPDDIETARTILRYLYSRYDEFILAVEKSQGTKWEHCKDSFADWNFKHLSSTADLYCKKMGLKKIDPFIMRMVSQAQINCFVSIILNIPTCEEAEKYIPSAVNYLVGGWSTLFEGNQA